MNNKREGYLNGELFIKIQSFETKMKFILVIILFLNFALAQKGSCGDDCTWSYSDGLLEIKGSGAMTDYESYGDSEAT